MLVHLTVQQTRSDVRGIYLRKEQNHSKLYFIPCLLNIAFLNLFT